MHTMEESQTLKNGQTYLQNKRTIMLGISPGNPFYYKVDNLQRLFRFAETNTHKKILLFLGDKISEHNFRAVGSKNPEKSARLKANRLRNKCKEALDSCGTREESVEYVDWNRDIESSPFYLDALNNVRHLYQANDRFQKDIQESTRLALLSLKNGREKSMTEKSDDGQIDLEEGVKYVFKELAFFSVVSQIYKNCEEFVFVYHRRWSVLEKYFDGEYDNISRPCLGFCVLE